ncbi:Eco57I restriction-modification methylase domain-containing protein [Rhodosalinus sp. 5P4]|uniref:Eco57I restriction-modification methylase domain-containing protein n=1 Tax=Rhodosalinus sp. 5P4 TaxID=3239196 RepID=UPI0035268EF7
MTEMSMHGEWLALLEISGPFLAEPVLKDAFPQGLEDVASDKRRLLRQAYDEWREAKELEDADLSELHQAWIDLVLRQGLELDEDGAGDILKSRGELADGLCHRVPEHDLTLVPDYAVVDDREANEPLMLISVWDPDRPLDEPVRGDGWATSPAERMVELCRATGTRLGLVTNGERWMLVDAPVGAVTTFASWYARLWSQEPKTLQAFVNLLGVRRFFVGKGDQLPALLDASLKLQDEVTDALGEQVRRAVEVLIQSLDRADVDRNRELLAGIEPSALYEAGLTVMMRIVFLLSAEERGLLLLGDERYEANYAVSTLRLQLRAESEEILERRNDAWSRLLAIFRAVYGGIEHEALRMPALGGSLFDPDRYPFLEGRARGTDWRKDAATPLPIDNRTVLLLLDAVQLFQGRALSYRALDVEQIGYVYEGLLERTVVRADHVTLDLDATKNAKKPWVTLDEVEEAAAKGDDAVAGLLKERTGSSASRVKNDLSKAVDASDADKLLTACHGSTDLRDRIKPYFHFLRTDRWGYPLAYPVGTFMVTSGSDRRETGTHYTPKSLTEAIVKETLEPIVYVGPSEGKSRDEWQLKSPAELLDLKICDPAMGSGAFLVQVCRWLAERLVEAWVDAEGAGQAVTADGIVVERQNGYEPLRNDPEERLLTARRLIAERCLYGVDVNPLAVELAKLSIWLVTLAKGRPFGFLDHNLRAGDSLLGIRRLEQLLCLEMEPSKNSARKLFAAGIDKAVSEAVALRTELRSRPIRDIRDVEAMAGIDKSARRKLRLPELVADGLVAEALTAGKKAVDTTSLSIEAGKALGGDSDAEGLLRQRATNGLKTDLATGKPARRPFHWPLEFPEVFGRDNGGFDAFVGNPPFLGGTRISTAMGAAFREYLVNNVSPGAEGRTDLVAHFFNSAHMLLRKGGCFGLLATNSIAEGETRQASLERIADDTGSCIYKAFPNEVWPGKAAVITTRIHVKKGDWLAQCQLSGRSVPSISSFLSDQIEWTPKRLKENSGGAFIGSYVLGMGFVLSEDDALSMISKSSANADVVLPYLNGKDLNSHPTQKASRWVINFWNWTKERARKYPEPYLHLKEHVYDERLEKSKQNSYRNIMKMWWLHWNNRPGLYKAIGRGKCFGASSSNSTVPLNRVLVCARVSKTGAFAFVENNSVFSDQVIVFPTDEASEFVVLQSAIHNVYAWKHSSQLKSDMRYTPTDVYETFPLPDRGEITTDAKRRGEDFHERRSRLMRDEALGLTKFYGRFHNKANEEPEYLSLRTLQATLDNDVLAAYGWTDLDLGHGFHAVSYLPETDNIRFTISEDARIEILNRLAQLNKERHEAEKKPKPAAKRASSATSNTGQSDDLFSAQGGGR